MGAKSAFRGIYIPNDERWPKHFRGMGIRIEDSVCVQAESPLVLTTEAIKEVGYLFAVWHGHRIGSVANRLTFLQVVDIEAMAERRTLQD